MRIDRSHRSWAAGTAAALAAALVLYAVLPGRGGGSARGLGFGIAGFAMMLYAGLIGARRRVRVWRLGRAQTWMRGHLWLGLLSFPVILLHADLVFGYGLTSLLMWLFAAVVLSGIAGAWLQHVMPGRLLREVPLETIYDQMASVRAQLLAEADTVVADACGRLDVETVVPSAAVLAAPAGPAASREGQAAAAAALATTARIEADVSAPLREFYLSEMRSFVEHPAAGHPLADAVRAASLFEKVRTLVPPDLHPAIADLENICEEERQLIRQRRLHRVLHAWLLVHVPLSIALLVLAAVHAVAALGY